MPFQNLPSPSVPPLSHRPHWVVVGTVGLALTAVAAFFGVGSLVIFGGALVVVSAVGFIRDWHFPLTRNRAENPGWVDRRRKRKADQAAQIENDRQRKLFEDAEKLKTAQELFSSVVWRAEHRIGVIRSDARVVVVSLKYPKGLDPRESKGWTASCRIEQEGKFHVAQGETGPFGIDLTLPQDFEPQMGFPLPVGFYEVEWFPDFPATVERDCFVVTLSGGISLGFTN